MPARRFQRIARAQLLLARCAVVFGVCVLIEHPQAQPGYVPPPTPLPPPVFNPSSPSTVPQPSYRPITPTTPSATPSAPSTVPSGDVTSPANEEPPSTTARSERQASVAKTLGPPPPRPLNAGDLFLRIFRLCSYLCVGVSVSILQPLLLSGWLLPAIWLVSLSTSSTVEARRIAANIAKLPELLRGTVTREAEEDWGR